MISVTIVSRISSFYPCVILSLFAVLIKVSLSFLFKHRQILFKRVSQFSKSCLSKDFISFFVGSFTYCINIPRLPVSFVCKNIPTIHSVYSSGERDNRRYKKTFSISNPEDVFIVFFNVFLLFFLDM